MWYMTEAPSINSLRKPEALKAKTLRAAKEEAENKQFLASAVVAVGQTLDVFGFLNPELMKISGSWVKVIN